MLYPTLWRSERFPSIWRDLFNVRNEFDRLFDRLGREGADFSGWVPTVDVRETGDALLVEAELPGLTPGDVDVRVENGVLTISGEKRREAEEGKDDSGYRIVERCYGRFERSFTLPRSVDADKVSAEFSNGVLTVSLPKAETAKPRKIEVKAGNGRKRIGSK